MKKLLPFILLLLPLSHIQAQQDSAAVKKTRSSFFVQFEGQGAYTFSKAAMLSGISLNWLINKKFYIGAKYNALSSPLRVNTYNYTDSLNPETREKIFYQSATLNFGYILFSEKKFSFNPEIGLGWGEISSANETRSTEFKLHHFVAAPALNAIWNAHKNLRVGAQIGGRIAYGQNFEKLQSFHASGFFGGVFLRVGKF